MGTARYMKRRLLLAAGLVLCVATTLASDREKDQSAVKPLIDEIIEDYTKARLAVNREYERQVTPFVQRHQKSRADRVRKAGNRAIASLRRIRDDAKRQGSVVGAAMAEQATGEITKSISQAQSSPDVTKVLANLKGHRYLAVVVPVTWQQAKTACEELGGHLVCIETAEEMAFVRKLTGGAIPLWVGATDLHRQGDWRWLNGKQVDSRLWVRGVPSHRHQRHVGINWRGRQGLFNMRADDGNMRGFICEWQ